MKNLHLDLVKVTEAGAIAASQFIGSGDKLGADKAATEAMQQRLDSMDFVAEIAIGEGIKDGSYGLYQGDRVGSLKDNDPLYDYEIAVDPIEGTTPTAKGYYEAMSVIALAGKGCFFKTEEYYMYKVAGCPALWDFYTDINSPVEKIIKEASHVLGRKPDVCVLDRPRHAEIVKILRNLGCRIKFITDCDVSACIATCFPDSGIDLYIGVGGAPEAVITAAAMKCVGGFFQAQIASVDANGFTTASTVYNLEDLAKGNVMFSATGITDGRLLKGVKYRRNSLSKNGGHITHSLTMRSESGTIRKIETHHGFCREMDF